MKKLNNKGITTIEVIICFVLVVMITVSMYSTVSYFNDKRIIENYKEQVYSYKDLLTKEIQDDFIKIGLTHAEYEKSDNGAKTIHTLTCVLKDGTRRQLIVEQTVAKSSNHMGGSEGVDDYFMIKYGNPDKSNGMINHPLPDLGHSGYDYSKNEVCDADLTAGKDGYSAYCKKIQDLRINSIIIKIIDENILSIYIGFDHPELSTRYGINIVVPIDYVTDGGLEDGGWDLY